MQAELGEQFAIRYPRMPNEGEPLYATWKAALYKEMKQLDDSAILVGHSVGGTILLHAVAEQRPKRKWRAIVLNAGCWPSSCPCRRSLERGAC